MTAKNTIVAHSPTYNATMVFFSYGKMAIGW